MQSSRTPTFPTRLDLPKGFDFVFICCFLATWIFLKESLDILTASAGYSLLVLILCQLSRSTRPFWHGLVAWALSSLCWSGLSPKSAGLQDLTAVERWELVTEHKKSNQFLAKPPGHTAESFCLIVLPPDHQCEKGDVIRVDAKARPIKSIGLDRHFDYEKYAKRKGISYRLVANQYDVIHRDELSTWDQNRSRWKQSLTQSIDDPDTQALMLALVFGDRAGMSDDLEFIFRRSGSLHVLAVSGLHVGIAWGFVCALLSFLSFWYRLSDLWSLFISLGVIWFYAALTGFSPSVSRSALMISMLLGSRLCHFRSANSLNILALSAVVLITIDEQLLFDIGFQYSYAAVFGIILFFPKLAKLTMNWSWFFRGPARLMGVSLIAQLFIGPLSLYYFGELSTLSIVSSLIAIPAVTVLVCMGFLVLLGIICFGTVHVAITTFLSAVISVLLRILHWFARLEFSMWEFDSLDIHAVISIYAVMLLWYMFYGRLKQRYLFYFLLVTSMALVSYCRLVSIQKATQSYAIKWDEGYVLVRGDHVYATTDKLPYELRRWLGEVRMDAIVSSADLDLSVKPRATEEFMDISEFFDMNRSPDFQSETLQILRL